MAVNPREEKKDAASDVATRATASPAYEPPRLIEYGPLAKITQTSQGSSGESTNFTMRKCL